MPPKPPPVKGPSAKSPSAKAPSAKPQASPGAAALPPPRWRHYPCMVNGSPGSVLYDDALTEHLDELPPTLLRLRVRFRQPDPRGLPRPEEYPALDQVEAGMRAWLEGLGGRHLGRITYAGASHHAAHVDVELSRALNAAQALSRATGLEIGVALLDDPDHKAYFDELYPSAAQHAVMEEVEQMDRLLDAGDHPEAERPLHHAATFPGAEAAAAFAAWAEAQGFLEVAQAQVPGDGRRPALWEVGFGEHGDLRPGPRLQRSEALRAAAAACGGHYSGWTCPPA